MKTHGKTRRISGVREELAEAYEVRAFRDDTDVILETDLFNPEITHAEAGAIQEIKKSLKGHGEQTVLPDDCQFGDNDLCFVES